MELDETTMGVIGILAGILILSGWVPQIVRGYKTKRLNDVSPYLMILIFAGAVLWLIYGIALDDVYIMGVNVAAMVLTMIVLSMKLKYERLAQTTSEWLEWTQKDIIVINVDWKITNANVRNWNDRET